MIYIVESIYHVTDLPGLTGANISLRPVDGDSDTAMLMITRDSRLFSLVAGDTVTISIEPA